MAKIDNNNFKKSLKEEEEEEEEEEEQAEYLHNGLNHTTLVQQWYSWWQLGLLLLLCGAGDEFEEY